MASILIIEDDELFRVMLVDVLSGYGYTVTQAANGDEGLKVFQAQPTDLVLTDIVMPGKEGIATVQELRRSNPSLGIIAMSGGTAQNAPLYLNLANGLGADRTLQKPFSIDLLRKTVEAVLAMGHVNRPRRTRPPMPT